MVTGIQNIEPTVIPKSMKQWEGSLEQLRGLVSERALTGETVLLPEHGPASSQHARRAALAA